MVAHMWHATNFPNILSASDCWGRSEHWPPIPFHTVATSDSACTVKRVHTWNISCHTETPGSRRGRKFESDLLDVFTSTFYSTKKPHLGIERICWRERLKALVITISCSLCALSPINLMKACSFLLPWNPWITNFFTCWTHSTGQASCQNLRLTIPVGLLIFTDCKLNQRTHGYDSGGNNLFDKASKLPRCLPLIQNVKWNMQDW